MGVYINDMEMPKEESWVTLRLFPDGQCFLYSWCGNDFDFMEHLTAVPVPPHGRLIDADALTFEDDYYGWRDKKVVKAAPIIIPASEEGE